jgi:hypothetical protein
VGIATVKFICTLIKIRFVIVFVSNELPEAKKLSVMRLDGKMFCVVSATIIRKVLEIIWLIKILK